jgi:hypothetical protein
MADVSDLSRATAEEGASADQGEGEGSRHEVDVGASAPSLTNAQLRSAAVQLIQGSDLTTTTFGSFRGTLAEYFKLPHNAFDNRKAEIDEFLPGIIREHCEKKSDAHAEEEEDVGEEDPKGKPRRSYLVTLSHTGKDLSQDGQKLVAPGTFSREAICAIILAVLAATQGPRITPLVFVYLAIFLERHQSQEIHFHIAVLADRCFRFAPLKKELLRTHGLASHWSCSHDHYATCAAYGYLPSPKKPAAELDPMPHLWAHGDKEHPPLAIATRAPVTAGLIAQRREKDRRQRAEEGKGEGRFRDVDIWPLVIQENIMPDASCAERVMAYAKRCGGPAMVEFCFHNWDKLKDIVARSWKVERVEEFITKHDKSRMELLHEALGFKCTCAGAWFDAARHILNVNDIHEEVWRKAMLEALADGRSKGNLVTHAGVEGNEGKSLLLRPLGLVFGADMLFSAPPKNAFPLVELEQARVVLLDDWRFNEEIISYNLQLLWFEGATFVIARPQNQFSGHLRYTKDDPIFITTLESDITSLKNKRNLAHGDIDMMLKRLMVFHFKTKVNFGKDVARGCGHCFARFLLEPATPRPALLPIEGAGKRKAAANTGSTPEAKKLASWSVADVATFLERLELGHVVPAFADNGVDGRMLMELSEDDLIGELGLKRLQARKIVSRLRD